MTFMFSIVDNFNGIFFQDVNECLSKYLSGCDENGVCENLPGSYLCHCNKGLSIFCGYFSTKPLLFVNSVWIHSG